MLEVHSKLDSYKIIDCHLYYQSISLIQQIHQIELKNNLNFPEILFLTTSHHFIQTISTTSVGNLFKYWMNSSQYLSFLQAGQSNFIYILFFLLTFIVLKSQHIKEQSDIKKKPQANLFPSNLFSQIQIKLRLLLWQISFFEYILLNSFSASLLEQYDQSKALQSGLLFKAFIFVFNDIFKTQIYIYIFSVEEYRNEIKSGQLLKQCQSGSIKQILLILMMLIIFPQQVQHTNRCNDCGQLKSQTDCESEITVTGACEWVAAQGTTAAKCQKKTIVDPVTYFKPYCELVDKPETNCAKTLGCAYIDSKCTHFAGCQAYVKTTTTDCQAISYYCVSDGNACIEAKECKDYTQQQCESTPSILGILKCKWDTNAGNCRDYACSEVDTTLNTDEKCSTWLGGCVTKRQGCVNAPRPACATYTGDDATCQPYIGSDGNCELAAGTTNCKAKECANAPVSLASDDDCKAYQKGCITTGKGCVLAKTKPLCFHLIQVIALLVLDILDQMEFVKVCWRKCENGVFNTDELCKQYQSSCKTNGKTCVSTLSACNTYKGTATTCAVYIGTDGYCKGTSTTTEATCAPKVCDEAPDTTTTDDACAKYQIGCVTTGKGCVTKNNLKSCTTYDGDATSCQSRIGTEGKCTWKSGTKCVARDCASAASNVNTNFLCANYFTNCVTTGSGCVSQTTCDLTVKQQSCEGTNNCSWQPICTSNASCSDFKKKSICLANQARIRTQDGVDDQGNAKYIYVTGKCGWLNNACKDLACSDLTGAYYNTDANCAAELSTCISNRVDACITKQDCEKLFGTQSTCLSYPGYCTKVSLATDTTPCVLRKCTDNTDATDNATCATSLPGCISNGKGCVDYNTPFTSMKGTQDTCNKLFAYKSGAIINFNTNQCYNSASAADTDFCKVKTCKLAENQTDGTCGSFLDGCVYNGNGGCVDPKAGDTTCGSYTGIAAFCESAIVGTNNAKYCFGQSTSAACTQRTCTDNTTATKDEGL
ncbi:unnamed protein product [Paramecium octaurelia]|uniref:Transmembrane protein n=1 Tax=Paramecium octaurelia TaxID=43137 RepID=A0A8S1WWR0_PAROT|nr:unnamed protein product [Paramecium octaurelia]